MPTKETNSIETAVSCGELALGLALAPRTVRVDLNKLKKLSESRRGWCYESVLHYAIEDFPPGLRNLVAAYTDQAVKLVKERAEKEKELAIKTTLNLAQEVDYSCALLAAIEVLGVSTDPRKRNGQKPRLQRFSEGMEKHLQYFGGVFGIDIIEGLRGRLLSYGVKLEAPKHD